MLRLWLFLTLLFLSLHAITNQEILQRADVSAKSNSKSDNSRAYNDYKNLYLRSIMKNNEVLKVSSLRGIVKMGKRLHIDVARYESELKTLDKKKVEKKKTNVIKPKKVPPKKKTNASKSNKKVQIKSLHKLKSLRWKDGRIVLKFDKNLKQHHVNYFKLYDKKKKRYRYIFDIKPSMITSRQTLKHKDLKRISLAQYKPDTLRLVIENDKKIKVNFKRDHELLVINLGLSNVQSPRSVSNKPLRNDKRIIVIDPGHGGKDPGAVGYKKYREKIVVMQVAAKLTKILKRAGHTVYLTRSSDKFIKLKNRTKLANNKNADIFVSIHANAVPKRNAKKAHGIETYFLSPARSKRSQNAAAKENSADLSAMNTYGKQSFLNFLSREKILASNKLAIDLQQGMLSKVKKQYKIKDGGVRPGPFWVLVGAQMPAVLVEIGFISHPTEAKKMVNRKYQDQLAQGLAEGIERYFRKN